MKNKTGYSHLGKCSDNIHKGTNSGMTALHGELGGSQTHRSYRSRSHCKATANNFTSQERMQNAHQGARRSLNSLEKRWTGSCGESTKPWHRSVSSKPAVVGRLRQALQVPRPKVCRGWGECWFFWNYTYGCLCLIVSNKKSLVSEALMALFGLFREVYDREETVFTIV